MLTTFCLLPLLAAADQWAVLVAGSNNYWNYRHQADILHAYQIFKSHGVPDSNIITFMFDDIANNPSNPFPGQVFNAPTPAGTPGINVYANVGTKDYTGNDVTPQNFLNVITGNAAAMAGIGSGRVLKSGVNDTVFINFDDHGGVGIICFPSTTLDAADLNKALNTMYQQKLYGQLVFYLETCESGSMFENILPANLNIYVTTAANAEESSWGTYCPPDDMVNGVDMNTCLGDLYSTNWMEDIDANGLGESLQAQYVKVQAETAAYSHVMQYGSLDFVKYTCMCEQAVQEIVCLSGSEPLSTFFGPKAGPSKPQVGQPRGKSSTVSSRDIPMHLAYYEYLRHDDLDFLGKLGKAEALTRIINTRLETDLFFLTLAKEVAASATDAETLFHNYPPKRACGDCCAQVISSYETSCGRFDDYSLKYARVLANLCHYTQMRVNTNDATGHVVKVIQAQPGCH